MAHTSGQSIQSVAIEGPGLVFIVYPAAIGELKVSPSKWKNESSTIKLKEMEENGWWLMNNIFFL